jgi:hypothetical protein
MRITKIKGQKYCTNCGVKFNYMNNRKIFCGSSCQTKYNNTMARIRERPITLAFIPERLMGDRGV